MKKNFVNILLISIASFFFSNAAAQQKTYNSTDTSYISELIKTGDSLKYISADTAYKYYRKALSFSKKQNNKAFQIKSYAALASLLISEEKYPEALKYYALETELCEKTGDKKHLKYAVGNSGAMQFYLGNYGKALQNFYKLEKISRELNDSAALATANLNIGLIFEKLEEDDKALDFFNKTLNIAEEMKSDKLISDSYNNIGLIYRNQKKYSEAEKYFRKALRMSEKMDKKEDIAITLLNIGMVQEETNNPEEAEKTLNKALETAREIKNNRITAEILKELSEVKFHLSESEKYNKTKKRKLLNQAVKMSEESYKTAKKFNYLNIIKKTSKLLTKLYVKKNNTRKALKYALEYIDIKDSLFNKENIEAIQKTNAKYEIYKNNLRLEQQEKEIIQNNKIIKTQKRIIKYGLTAAIIFFFFLFYITYLYFKLKNKKNEILKLKKLQDTLINNLPAYIYLKSSDLTYLLANESYANLLNMSLKDLIGKRDKDIDEAHYKRYEELDRKIIAENKALEPVIEKYTDKTGNEYWVSIKKVPFHDLNGNIAGIIGIVSDITELKNLNLKLKKLLDKTQKQKKQIEVANKNINDSLIFAKTIQDAVLPGKKLLNETFKNHFIIYKGQQTVSGDFYYVNKINDTLVFALGDCTGHGVPGGFLSMLSVSFLNQIISVKENIKASEILEELRIKILDIFSRSDYQNKNGLDIALCSVNLKTKIMQYAGAYSPIYLLTNSQLTEYKGTRIPVGFYFADKKFENYEIQLKQNDKIYMFTDGFKDQTGGPENKKFTSKRLKQLILENHKLPFDKQKEIIEKTFTDWLGNNDQFDDVSMFAVQIF
ncbi:MAG: tetratricopeptide repeat protein [Chlorobi bacterium]|nr:tetratricopeptide repeat protein [Chlorobiota bacterium]